MAEKRGNCYVYGIVVDDRSGAAPVLRYVGKATYSKKQSRFQRHMWDVRKLIAFRNRGQKYCPKQPKLCCGLAAAVERGHEIREIIFYNGLNDESAFRLEQALIAAMQPELRLNIAAGGLGMTSVEAKRLWECEETRRKMCESFKGRVLSDEGRKRMSESRKGRVISEEHREKLRSALKGRRRSEEICLKISAGKRGRPRSVEARAALSKAAKARFARERAEGKINRRARPVITPNGQYDSATSAAAAYGISFGTAAKRARNQWNGWSYIKSQFSSFEPSLPVL